MITHSRFDCGVSSGRGEDADLLDYAAKLSFGELLHVIQSFRRERIRRAGRHELLPLAQVYTQMVRLLEARDQARRPSPPEHARDPSWAAIPPALNVESSALNLESLLSRLRSERSRGQISRSDFVAAKAKLAAEHNRIAGELVVALKNYSRESRLRRAAWLAFDALEAEWQRQAAVRYRVIEDLKADSLLLVANSSRATDDGYRRVFWEILPAGEGSFAAMWAEYRSYLHLHPGAKLEPERLKYLDSLGPSVRYRGLNEWRDYRVFGFPELQRAAFECPVSGNALFVVDFGQWARLSRLTKDELRRLPECEARIIHRDTWKETLRANLGLKPEWVETLESNFLYR